MQGVEVGIEEVLICRERRVDIQNEMIKKYNMPLISFTMNIPGPIKTNQQIKKAFDIGKKLILEKFKENIDDVFEDFELSKDNYYNDELGEVNILNFKKDKVAL